MADLKTCLCGATYSDARAFRKLPFAGLHVEDPEIGDQHLELRNCPCGSTLAVDVCLVTTTASELRLGDVIWIPEGHPFARECNLVDGRKGRGLQIARRKSGQQVAGVELAVEFAGGRKGLFDAAEERTEFQAVEIRGGG